MTDKISTIVDVQIDRLTKVPSRVGFGEPLILDQNTVQSVGAVDTFTDLQAMLDAGFSTGDEAYKAAQALLSQNPRPPQFKVARREADGAKIVEVSVDNVVDSTAYDVTVAGNLFSFNSGVGATADSIRDGLIALIDADPNYSAAIVGAGVLSITSAAGNDFSVVVGANLGSSVSQAAVNVASEILRVVEVNNDWYFLLMTGREKADILSAAATIETLIKVFAFETDEADTKDLPSQTDTTSIGAVLQDLNYDRTFYMWTKTSNLENYPAAAWVGKVGPKDPGSVTWKFKSLAGVLPDDELTSTELANILNKNGNYYQTVAGQGIINSEAKVASGEFIDIIRGTDWLTRRLQEDVFTLLINEDKVPFTNKGGDSLKLQVDGVMDEGIAVGLLRGGDDRPVVTVPDVNDINIQDRAARIFGDIEFEGFYAGAVHKVKIRGRLSV